MINVKLVCVGSLKEDFLKQAVEEYKKRLSKFCKLTIIEVSESKLLQTNSLTLINKIKEEESNNILKHCSGFVILLDVLGQALTSEEFASKINEVANFNSTITFIIGGSYGVSEELKNKVNFKFSMSKLTFPHQLIRVLFLEQLYRSFTIINNITYHK